jgi:hypothetical protein
MVNLVDTVVSGGIAGAFTIGAAAVVWHLQVRRGRSRDVDQLKVWMRDFDRPAWRGEFRWHTDLDRYREALNDAIRAIATGVPTGGAPVPGQTLGMSSLKDPDLRAALSHMTDRIVRIRSASWPQGPPPAADYDIDTDRDAVIIELNDEARRFGLEALPLPSTFQFTEVRPPKESNPPGKGSHFRNRSDSERASE